MEVLEELSQKDKFLKNLEFATNSQTRNFENRISNLEYELEKSQKERIKLEQVVNHREVTLNKLNLEKGQLQE